jgi:hypothetical protein
MNLMQRLNAIRKDAGYVQKNAEVNAGGRYRAVKHDDVVEAVREKFVEHGVMMLLSCVSCTDAPCEIGAKKSPGWRTTALFDVTFVNVDDPTDRETLRVPAQAEDFNDKGAGKAISYAKKYVILTALMMVTGDEEEQRGGDGGPSRPARPTISKHQEADLRAICEGFGWDADERLRGLAKAMFKVDGIEDLYADEFERAKELLHRKAAQEKEKKAAES